MKILSHIPHKRILLLFLACNLLLLLDILFVGVDVLLLCLMLETCFSPFIIFVFITQFFRYYYTIKLEDSELKFKRFFTVKKIKYSDILEIIRYRIPYRDGTIHELLKIKIAKKKALSFCIEQLHITEKMELIFILKDKTNLKIIEKNGYV